MKGQRPCIPNSIGFSNIYLYGSINPETGERVGIMSDGCTSEIMNTHIKQISLKVSPNSHILLVLDGAAWHRSAKLKVPENMTLIYLPPYSPELNPIEQLWGYMKEKYIKNVCFKSLDHIFEIVCNAWFKLNDSTVKSVCNADHILEWCE